MEAIAIARQLEQKEASKNSKGVELYKYPTPVNSNQELFGQGLEILHLVFPDLILSPDRFLDQPSTICWRLQSYFFNHNNINSYAYSVIRDTLAL